METDRFEPSRKARASMLKGVYEENRRIKEGTAAALARRRRHATAWSGGVLAVLLLVVVGVQVLGSDPPEATRVTPTADGARAILQANLPVPDASFDYSPAIRPEDFSEMLAASPSLASLFSLQVRTIVLDPGHGGVDPGAIGVGGAAEAELTLDVALRLRRRLQARGYDVLMTRSADSTVSLRERVEFANSQPTDLFVSIHANSFPDEPVNALETYYFGANSESALLRLAEAENQGADYTVADFNSMIRRLGSTVKLQESRRLAVTIQQSLVHNTREIMPDVKDWGVKAGPFVVLLGSDAPSVLAEISVLTNRDQAGRLRQEAHREQLSAFLEEGILNYLVDRTQRNSTAPQ